MKKLLLGLGLVSLISSASAATIVVNATTNGYYLLSTNRASLYSVELTCANPAVVQLFDCDSILAPFYGTNYTNAAFVGRTTYATNLVTSYVGSNGYTNWYTNAGLYTLTVTNAAGTNALAAMASFVIAGGTYAVYNADALFARGICATISTNVSMVLYYRSAQ